MGFLDVPVTGAQLAGKVDKGSVVINVLDYGAKGDWNPYTSTGTDDTAAIRAALAATPQGGTLFFPGFGNTRKYLISEQIDITTYNVRLLGAPRDTYASAIRMNTTGPAMTMFRTLAPGTVFENLGIEGGGGAITGVEVWGDTDGNCDTRFLGVCFTRLFVAARVRGRNVSFMGECIVSVSTEGFVFDGPDPVYHTGANAANWQRGYKIDGCLFHGNGSASTQGSIRFAPENKTKYAVISNNSFDGGGKNTHIIAQGTSTDPIQHLHITDNTHNDMGATAYDLTWVQNSTINGANIQGTTSTAGVWSNTAINLASCKWLGISNVSAESIGRHGFKAVSSSYLWVSGVTFNGVGLDTGAVYDGFNVDATNTVTEFSNLFVTGAPGWGFNGSPTNVPSLDNCRFFSCTLGAMNSTTMHNRVMSGRNLYIEGAGGRKNDYASKSFDLTVAGGATQLATVLPAHAYSSFEVEVKIIGRNSAGPIYAKCTRYVRPENGVPVYVTVGTDTLAGTITVAFSTSGSGIAVSATVTGSDAYVTAHITALAGGGSASNAARGVLLTMA